MKRQRGQATLEMALIFMTVVAPLTLGLIGIANVVWTYHTLALLTRKGAQYAATQCYSDASGSAVQVWMKTPQNIPQFLDERKFISDAQITVQYWSHDLSTPQWTEFQCSSISGSCGECMPDSVTVSISGYQIRTFLSVLGIPGILTPSFQTTVQMQSGGANQDL